MADSFNPELFFKRCDREIIREFIEKKKSQLAAELGCKNSEIRTGAFYSICH